MSKEIILSITLTCFINLLKLIIMLMEEIEGIKIRKAISSYQVVISRHCISSVIRRYHNKFPLEIND